MAQSYYGRLEETLPKNTLKPPFTVEFINHVWVKLNHLICGQIKSDLTTGRSDNELEPLSQKKITDYIKNNQQNIDKIIIRMFTDFICDEDSNPNETVDDLKNPENDWIREYLYECIDTSVI
jgi:hypothetical protein